MRASAALAVTRAALAMAVASNEARADDEHQKVQASHQRAVTLDALQLFDRMIELSAEHALPYDFSVAASAGFGIEPRGQWALGAQGRYYVLGDFNHGMPIVCEARFVRDGREDEAMSELRLSLMLGYKLALRSGFTVFVAPGIGVAAVWPSPERQISPVGLVVDSGIGWSF